MFFFYVANGKLNVIAADTEVPEGAKVVYLAEEPVEAAAV